jgi:hypothetical protein
LNENQSPEIKKLDGGGDTSVGVETGVMPGLEGTDDPMWIYLTCYKTLKANKDSRAGDMLSEAKKLLEDQVQKIEDPDLQYSFLNNVNTNREIQSAANPGGDN